MAHFGRGVFRRHPRPVQQPQTAFFVRTVRQPERRLLRLHPQDLDQQPKLPVRRRQTHHGDHLGSGGLGPLLGAEHPQEPRSGHEFPEQPPGVLGRLLHPRHEGHAHRRHRAAGHLRCGFTQNEQRRPAHQGLRTFAQLARRVPVVAPPVLVQRDADLQRLHHRHHQVRQPRTHVRQNLLRRHALGRNLGLPHRRTVRLGRGSPQLSRRSEDRERDHQRLGRRRKGTPRRRYEIPRPGRRQ